MPNQDNYEPGREKLVALWRQISQRFANYSEKLIFETMNEPRLIGTDLEWTGGSQEARQIINLWNADAIATIRENNPKRFIMIPTYAASSEEIAIESIRIPDDDRVIVSLHAFLPKEMALDQNSPFSSFDPLDPVSTQEIDAMLERIQRVFLRQSIPVVIGETGAVHKNNPIDRLALAQYFASRCAMLGLPAILWDNGSIASDGTEAFGLMDRRNISWWDSDIPLAWIGAY
jgi:endoglucanase